MAKKKKKAVGDASTEQGVGAQRAFPNVSGAVKKAAKKAPAQPVISGSVKKAAKQPKQPTQQTQTSTPPAEEETPAVNSDAYNALKRYIIMAGFPVDMVDFLYSKMNDGTIPEDAGIEDYLAVAVEHPSFKARFPSIVEQFNRRAAGDTTTPIMTPGQVIDYEMQVRNAADDYGLSSWVSSPDQISKLILNNVSVDEALERINMAGYAAQGAPEAFRKAFMGKFGLTEGNLVGYFLDPDKEEGEIRKQVTLGNVMGAALSHGFGNNWNIAERLYERGYVPQGATMDSVMSEFARAALTANLSSGLGGTVNEEERIDQAFGDAGGTAKVLSVAAQRAGRFNTSGGAVEGQTGVRGLTGARTT